MTLLCVLDAELNARWDECDDLLANLLSTSNENDASPLVDYTEEALFWDVYGSTPRGGDLSVDAQADGFGPVDSGLEAELFAGAVRQRANVAPPTVGGESLSESASGSDGVRREQLSSEDLSSYCDLVVTEFVAQPFQVLSASRLQSRCFAVEWRGSAVVDRAVVLRGVFATLGSRVSFVLGADARAARADYLLVVRLRRRDRRRDVVGRLMLGHGFGADGSTCEEGVFNRVMVPVGSGERSEEQFVTEMLRRCSLYASRSSFKEQGLFQRQDKTYKRPGRQKRVVCGSTV